MLIECPRCHFARDIAEEKVPAKATKATCPKCGHKFNFRERVQESQEIFQEDTLSGETEHTEHPEIMNQEKDIWSELESLDTESLQERQASTADDSSHTQTQEDIPWEHLDTYGFFPGCFRTIQRIMFSPIHFFQHLPLDLGFQRPLIFYLLIAEVQAIAQFLWQMLGVVPQMQGQAEGFLGMGLVGFGSVFLLIMYPVVLTVMLFVVSSLNHLCLLAVKSGEAGYEATYRVVSYSSAPMVLAVIPVFGPFVGWIWSMVCTFLGFMSVHQTSAGRVILAMLLPFVGIVVIVSLTIMLLGLPQAS